MSSIASGQTRHPLIADGRVPLAHKVSWRVRDARREQSRFRARSSRASTTLVDFPGENIGSQSSRFYAGPRGYSKYVCPFRNCTSQRGPAAIVGLPPSVTLHLSPRNRNGLASYIVETKRLHCRKSFQAPISNGACSLFLQVCFAKHWAMEKLNIP